MAGLYVDDVDGVGHRMLSLARALEPLAGLIQSMKENRMPPLLVLRSIGHFGILDCFRSNPKFS
jgi:hypothetical protein